MSVLLSLPFTFGAIFCPKLLMEAFASEPVLIEYGAEYLRTVGISYFLLSMLVVCSYYVIGKSVNMTTVSGIFPAGGDSKFGFVCDAITMWAVVVPIGLISAFTAVLYGWQGGMVGGSGIADVLTGVVSPSGKLTDTIAYDIRDYPADSNFGDDNRNIYMEDIYVGYRYFETFAAKKVQYPFGYGLSYTTFNIKPICTQVEEDKIHLTVNVANTGNCHGKETVQIYMFAARKTWKTQTYFDSLPENKMSCSE